MLPIVVFGRIFSPHLGNSEPRPGFLPVAMHILNVSLDVDGSAQITAKSLPGLALGEYHAVLVVGEAVPAHAQESSLLWSKSPSTGIRQMVARQKGYDCSCIGDIREGRVFDFKPGSLSPPRGIYCGCSDLSRCSDLSKRDQ